MTKYILLTVITCSILFSGSLLEAQDLKWTADNLEGINVIRNVDYVEKEDYADNKDKLDIFMPPRAGDVPVIVHFHGGALQQGNKSHGEKVAVKLVSQGYGVVSANYRLSPAVRHPAHIRDAAAAFAWVKQNIEQYGGDPGNVYVSGHSAGAYLAVLLALDNQFLAPYKLGTNDVKGTIAISPFLYVEETAKTRPKTVWGTDPADWLKASVTPRIDPGKNPVLLIYADGDADWRKAQNQQFARAMTQEGNKVQVVEVPGRGHLTLIASLDQPDDQVGPEIIKFLKTTSELR